MGPVVVMAELEVFCRTLTYEGQPVRLITTYTVQDGSYAVRWDQPEYTGFRADRNWARLDIRG